MAAGEVCRKRNGKRHLWRDLNAILLLLNEKDYSIAKYVR
jgi:hypothetical protein